MLTLFIRKLRFDIILEGKKEYKKKKRRKKKGGGKRILC